MRCYFLIKPFYRFGILSLIFLLGLARLHSGEIAKETDQPEDALPIFQISDLSKPLRTPNGEIIYELIGRKVAGTTDRHSLAYIVMPPGATSIKHFHPSDEETYHILKGRAIMLLNDEATTVTPGHTIYIAPGKSHKITNVGEQDLEYLAVTVPAWHADSSVYLEKWEDGRAVPLDTTAEP